MFEETGKKSYKLQPIIPDPVYNSVMVSKFVNHIMREGKKDVARKIVYTAFNNIKEMFVLQWKFVPKEWEEQPTKFQ
jgi:ribosomal protein S7